MYLDSAIIIKLLTAEPDSAFFKKAIVGQVISTSELALTEVRSALFSKHRAAVITGPECSAAWREFSTWIDQQRIEIHTLDSTTLKKARHTLECCHPAVALGTLDAIHVAECDLSQDFPLCATDKRMRDAAKILQIPLFPE